MNGKIIRDMTVAEREKLDAFLKDHDDKLQEIRHRTEECFGRYDFAGRDKGWEDLAEHMASFHTSLEAMHVIPTLAGYRICEKCKHCNGMGRIPCGVPYGGSEPCPMCSPNEGR